MPPLTLHAYRRSGVSAIPGSDAIARKRTLAAVLKIDSSLTNGSAFVIDTVRLC